MTSERQEISDLLRRFVAGNVLDWEFDDFISCRSEDPLVEAFRLEIAALPEVFPPETDAGYASHSGISRILEIAHKLQETVD